MMPARSFFGLCALMLLALAGCAGSRPSTPATETPEAGPVVARIAGTPIYLGEFERRYARTAGSWAAAADDSLAAYRDFLQRYIDYRLKVRAAEDAGLAADPAMQQEITSYRANLARPYLLEQEVLEPIVRDLFERQQTLVHVSHILLRLPPTAPPADTLGAYERLAAIADSIRAGADFGLMAQRHSEDPSAKGPQGAPGSRGDLGFITGGQTVQPFEDMAYRTPVGSVSPIVRTDFGYHLLKVHARRPAVGDLELAHLLIQPRGNTPADSAAARAEIEAIRARIADGTSTFEEEARRHSMDAASGSRGGVLGRLSYGQPVVASFKEAAFALAQEGAVSDVVETPYGFHLIKLIERYPVPTYAERYDDLKKLAARLPRARQAEAALVASIQRENGFTLDSLQVFARFEGVSKDSLQEHLQERPWPAPVRAQPIATLGDSAYTFGDLVAYAQATPMARRLDLPLRAQLRLLLEQYARDLTLDFAVAGLARRDPEFRDLMTEFRDGLLLFRLMEDSVWTRAAQDTLALRARYEANPDAFRFPERVRVVSLSAPADSLLEDAYSALDGRTPLAQVLAALDPAVRVDTVLVAGPTNSVYDQALGLREGDVSEPIAQRQGLMVLVHAGTEAPRRKTFEEARSEIVSAYQKELEDALVARLRARYRVEAFPERLEAAFKQPPPATASTR